MSHHFGSLLTGLLAAIFGTALAVAQIPELAVLAQFAFVGTMVGNCVALYRDRRGSDSDRRWRITTRWTAAGFVLGVVYVLVAGL